MSLSLAIMGHELHNREISTEVALFSISCPLVQPKNGQSGTLKKVHFTCYKGGMTLTISYDFDKIAIAVCKFERKTGTEHIESARVKSSL